MIHVGVKAKSPLAPPTGQGATGKPEITLWEDWGATKSGWGTRTTRHLSRLARVLAHKHGKLPEGCKGEWTVGKGDPNETPMPQEVAERA